MKAKIINAIITNKFNNWVDSLPDVDGMRDKVRKNTILTGGAIVSMLQGEPANDFDFYFRNKETALAIAMYYVAQFKAIKSKRNHNWNEKNKDIHVENLEDRIKIVVKSAGIDSVDGESSEYQYFEGLSLSDPESQAWLDAIVKAAHETPDKEKEKYEATFLSANAISLTDQVQLVIRFYGEPDQIHENYDFVHCTNYWTSWNRELVLRKEALESIINKELRYIGSRYPVASLMRTRKFIQRGWRITAGQMFKAVYQASMLDLNDFKVLEDQLTGVDTAYFSQVIRLLNEKSPDQKVDGAYLMELMDKLF